MSTATYERVAEGFDTDTELIDGVVYEVAPEMDPHSTAAEALFDLLRARYPDRRVKVTGSVELDDGSLWAPDVYVLDVPPDHRYTRYPPGADLLLAVEVSSTTWVRDSGPKLVAYARNVVPDYWVVKLDEGDVWQFSVATAGGPDGHFYENLRKVPLTHVLDPFSSAPPPEDWTEG